MADFTFNWNNYNPQADAERAAFIERQKAAMQGYAPNQAMSDYLGQQASLMQQNAPAPVPYQSQVNPNLQNDLERAKDMETLKSLEAQLAEVNGKIAEIENTGNNTERDIAAMALSIGDTSPYMTMVARQNEGVRQSANAPRTINDIVKNAWSAREALTSGELNTLERNKLANELRIAKQTAEEKAADLGYDLSENQWYNDIVSTLDTYEKGNSPASATIADFGGGFAVENPTQAEDILAEKARKKTLSDYDIDAIYKWTDDPAHKGHPHNSDFRALADKFKGMTKEARDIVNRNNAKADEFFENSVGVGEDIFSVTEKLKALPKEVRDAFNRRYTWNNELRTYIRNQ